MSSAYFLRKEGHRVTVIDKSDMTSGASFVNAGYITPSHIIPLASPGVIANGIKMMFDSASPFYMKPRWDTEFFKWAWYFHRSSTQAKVERAIPVIRDINLISRELFAEIRESGDLGDFQLERKGLLMLYKTKAAYDHEIEVARRAIDLGLEVSELDKGQLQAVERGVKIDAEGAIHYECDGHTTPTQIMPKMIDYLKGAGVAIKTNEEVLGVVSDTKGISQITTDKATYSVDELVLSAGSWSGSLARRLKINLPLQGGKGYRIDVKRSTGIGLPAILMEAKIAVTPMVGFTRFAGTMEFSGLNDRIRKERVAAIAAGAKRFYPEVDITEEEKEGARTGLRPVSPDGLPYIGRSASYKNLIFATATP